jgi:hypothetical protein
MKTLSKARRHNVDIILDRLGEGKKAEFMELAISGSPYTDLTQWLSEALLESGLSEEINLPGVGSLHRWWQKRQAINEQVKQLNSINTEFNGLDMSNLAQRLIYQLSQLSLDRIERIQQNNSLSDEAFLKQLPSLIREIRGLHEILRSEESKRLDQIYMDGAGKLYLMLKAAFADTPFESGFTEAAIASLEEMKQEAKSF